MFKTERLSIHLQRRFFLGWSLGLVLLLVYGLPLVWGSFSLVGAAWIDHTVVGWTGGPLAVLVHQALAQGEWPLWNPWSGLGAPLALDIPTALYSPFHWLLFPEPAPWAWELMILVRWFAIAAGVYAFLLSCRVRPGLAWIFALMYLFSGHLIYNGNSWHLNSLAGSPWLLYGINQIWQKHGSWGAWLVALGWYLLIVGQGFLDAVLTALLVGVILGVWLIYEVILYGFTRWRWVGASIAWGLAGFALGSGLAGVMIIPFVEMSQLSVPPWPGRAKTILPWQNLWSLFHHKLLDSRETVIDIFCNYLSLLLLPGILWGLFAFRRGSFFQKIWFLGFGGFAVLYLGKLFGVGFLQPLAYWPIFQEIRFEKYYGVAFLGLHTLSAMGLEWYLRGYGPRASSSWWAIGASIAALPGFYLIFWQSQWHNPYGSYALFSSALALGFIGTLWQTRQTPRYFWRIALIVGMQLWVDFPQGFLGQERTNTLFPPSAAYDWLKTQISPNLPERIYDTGNPPKRTAPYALNDIQDFSDGTISQRYFRFFGLEALKGKRLNSRVIAWPDYADLRHDLIAFLNVRYWLVPALVEPLAGHQVQEFPHILKDPLAFPRAWMVYDLQHEPDPELIFSAIVTHPQQFREKALVESPMPWTKKSVVPDLQASVRFLERNFNSLILEVETRSPGLLVLAEQAYPGWEAQVNGLPQEIWVTNYLYRGVWLEAGFSRVTLNYRPLSFRVGAWLSGISLGALVWLFFRRKKRAGSLS